RISGAKVNANDFTHAGLSCHERVEGKTEIKPLAAKRITVYVPLQCQTPIKPSFSRYMNCIVTAGPTYEPLDEVRRLINFSTGRLGSELGNFLVSRGHRVTLFLGQQATWGGELHAQELVNFGTTADLHARLQGLAGQPIDAIFHAAAVSDFTFGKVWRRLATGELEEIEAGKISSRIDSLVTE